MNKKIRVAIAGGTGYTGGELFRILLNHPNVEIVAATSSIELMLMARRFPWSGIIPVQKNMQFARSVCTRNMVVYGSSFPARAVGILLPEHPSHSLFISVPITYTVNTSMNIWKNTKKKGYARNDL